MMIMGHRGAPTLEPENTLLSISKAVEIGVDAVEIDVHRTKDNEIVIIHDSTVDRTTNGTGPVSGYTLEDLKKLDAGKGQTIPTLQEVIDFFKGKVRLVIEFKEQGYEEPVVELIRKNRMEENTYMISFWHQAVKKIKRLNDKIKTGILFVGCPVDTSIATHADADAFVMHYGFISREFVDLVHSQGLKVFIWNIDEPHLVAPFVQMGVDGIGSNDPGVLLDYLKKQPG